MKTRRNTSVGITLPLVVLLLSTVSIARPISDPDRREIKVTARRFEFSPRTITVRRGERVKLVVTSEDVDYGFAIKDFDIDQAIKAKRSESDVVFSLSRSPTLKRPQRRGITRATRLFRRTSSAAGSIYSDGYCDRSVRTT
jgi:hypothetical protein